MNKPICLEIRGYPIPGFKNGKMLIAKGKGGRPLPRPLLITRPDLQKVMDKMVASIESQLRSAFATRDAGTWTDASVQSWIASCVPADDCWAQVPEIHLKAELCKPGEEGASITIERL